MCVYTRVHACKRMCVLACVCMCESSLHDKITEKVQPECNFVFVEELKEILLISVLHL